MTCCVAKCIHSASCSMQRLLQIAVQVCIVRHAELAVHFPQLQRASQALQARPRCARVRAHTRARINKKQINACIQCIFFVSIRTSSINTRAIRSQNIVPEPVPKLHETSMVLQYRFGFKSPQHRNHGYACVCLRVRLRVECLSAQRVCGCACARALFPLPCACPCCARRPKAIAA